MGVFTWNANTKSLEGNEVRKDWRDMEKLVRKHAIPFLQPWRAHILHRCWAYLPDCCDVDIMTLRFQVLSIQNPPVENNMWGPPIQTHPILWNTQTFLQKSSNHLFSSNMWHIICIHIYYVYVCVYMYIYIYIWSCLGHKKWGCYNVGPPKSWFGNHRNKTDLRWSK